MNQSRLEEEQPQAVFAAPETEAAQDVASPQSVRELKRRLGSWRRKEREAALREIMVMGESGLDALFKILNERRVPEEVMKRRSIQIIFIVGSFSFLVANLLPGERAEHSLLASASFHFAVGASMIYASLGPPKYRRYLLEALGKTSDVRAIPHLLAALSGTGLTWSDRDAARAALLRLLPLVQFKHINLFAGDGRVRLHNLATDHDSRLQIAALKALEQVGDESSIAVVQEIVWHPELYPRFRKLQEAAESCLEYLKTHASRAENAQTLLRASHYTEHQDELLRPARDADDTPVNELLRPESKPDSERL